jgi:folate-binding protein YgfZ
MGTVRFEAYALLLQGTDLLPFLDGISTNHVDGSCTTVFTHRTAKIIDVCEVLDLGERVVLVGHAPQKTALLEHLLERILGRNISVSDISPLNHIYIGTEHEDVPEGTTVHPSFFGTMYIVPAKVPFQPSWTLEEWNEHRIEHLLPFHGHEVMPHHHPLACGLEPLVHPAKGCYIGQEVLTRMRSRGKQGHMLVRKPNPVDGATTVGHKESLCIVRTQ